MGKCCCWGMRSRQAYGIYARKPEETPASNRYCRCSLRIERHSPSPRNGLQSPGKLRSKVACPPLHVPCPTEQHLHTPEE